MIRHARHKHARRRTCVGCRQRAAVSELLRVVAIKSGDDSGPARFVLRPDPHRRMPGRGAHLHPTPGCLESALRRRAFGRALRISGVLDTGELSGAITGPHGADDPGLKRPVPTVGEAIASLKEQGTTDMSTR